MVVDPKRAARGLRRRPRVAGVGGPGTDTGPTLIGADIDADTDADADADADVNP